MTLCWEDPRSQKRDLGDPLRLVGVYRVADFVKFVLSFLAFLYPSA
jgi:hypothetical protein